MEASVMLDELAELQSQRDVLMLDHQEARRALIGQDALLQLDEMDEEFRLQAEAAEASIKALTDKVKDATLALGETVHGTYLMAVYNKPALRWDGKALDEFAKDHPVIRQFQKKTDPTVSIRAV